MKKLITALALVLACGFLSSKASAHAFLDHAKPAVGSTVSSAVTSVQIWFTEEIDPSGTKIQVFDLTGKEVDLKDSRPDHSVNNLETVHLQHLTPGQYHVVWKALCDAGHTTGGSFDFTVSN